MKNDFWGIMFFKILDLFKCYLFYMKFFLLNTAVFVYILERNCAPLGKQVNFITWSRKTLLIKF